MSDFVVKGWCPDAWRPMMAGDGLLVRVKPRLGRLTGEQVRGLCDVALAYGSGLIDMTRRANLQLRGVGEDTWPGVLDQLMALDLADADPTIEQRRNILVAPNWRAGDDSHRIACELLARLGELPDLPGKSGFAIDAGPERMLPGEAGDFRIERAENGGLILRADGRPAGIGVAVGKEVDALIALAHWYVESGGAASGRLARRRAALPHWAEGASLPAPPVPRIVPGPHALGMAYGLPFGRVEARDLAGLMEGSGAQALRLTPWRILLLEGGAAVRAEAFLSNPADPLLRAEACPGAPSCPQATVETRDLARRLAPHVDGRLHVSGCAKGCAYAHSADVTLTGRDGLFDLGLNARAGSPPFRSALNRAEVLAHFGAA